jgi:hypothetical protein
MSERTPALDTDTLKFGLLMESAQAHQRLAEAHLEKLKAHTQDLDGVVRDEIRRTLVAELQAVTAETATAARALREMKRAANLRGMLWNIGMAILCTAVPTVVATWVLPSPATIAALRAQQAALSQNVARLTQLGGKAQWRSCGEAARLCVRVDRGAPVYGEKADYYVVKGY